MPSAHRQRVPSDGAPIVPGFTVRYVGVLWDEPDDRHDPSPGAAIRWRVGGHWTTWDPIGQDPHLKEPGGFATPLLPAPAFADAYQIRGLPAHARGARTVALNLHD